MKQGLSLKTGLSLTMTPALQQAIRLLQLSTLDLKQEIQQALDSNVMLELVEGTEDEAATAEFAAEEEREVRVAADQAEREVDVTEVIPDEMPVDSDWSEVFDTPSSNRDNDDDLDEFKRANLRENETLQEHLRWQARLAPFAEWEAEVADYLIDAINEDGYLLDFPEAVIHFREAMGLDAKRVERVLRVVQDFDPPGVAARDLGECLSLQLHQMPSGTPVVAEAYTLVQKHLPLIARKDFVALRRASGFDEPTLRQALTLIQTLQPHPGRPYAAHESNYIEPDVYVTKHNDRWRVSLNRENVPLVRINPQYLGMVKRADSSRDQVTLKNHLQEARYFLHSLQSRNDTLLRVAQCIVEEQRAFLDYGPEAMRPLVLRDVAGQLDIHESTVSRATANKYLLTPRGLYELKHFFSSHVQTSTGGVASATAIQAMLKRLISAEEPANPLSDATLADLLRGEGMQVARRTVAKYREALGIPPSHERRPV
jgi:RNA polymerase sigma-54 factor